MKRYFVIPLLAVMLLFAACGKEESTAVPEIKAATLSEATRSEPAAATAAVTSSSTAQTTTPAAATKAAASTAPSTTVPATSKPVQDNIPADTITSGHINPYLSYIQGNVMSEISALAVTGISLSRDSITLEKGETADIEVSIEPSYAANKRCSVETENSCVKAGYKSGVLHLSAEKEGSCTVTLTSHNGLHAVCTVTVKESEKTDKQDTTAAPETEPTTEPETEETTEATEEPSTE